MKKSDLRFLFRSVLNFGLIFGFAAVATADLIPSRTSVSPGQKAPAFCAITTEGKTINFPDDFKGKVVLLDFWATWCGPCRAEVPNVVAAYNKLHDKGFEVLSVSLDRPKKGDEISQFAKDHNMAWPHIYDGQYWKADVAMQYGVRAIPCPVLVDGDTGTIIAAGVHALGSRLGKAVEMQLVARAKAVAEAKGN